MGLQLVLTYLKGKATFEVTTILQPRRTSIPFGWCAMVYSQNHPGATWSQSFEPCIPGHLKCLHDMSRLENLERQISQISTVSQISSQEQTAQIWDLAAKLFNPCTNCVLPSPLKAHGSTIKTRWEPRVRRIAQSAVTSYLNFGGSS